MVRSYAQCDNVYILLAYPRYRRLRWRRWSEFPNRRRAVLLARNSCGAAGHWPHGAARVALRHANVTYQAAHANHGAMLHSARSSLRRRRRSSLVCRPRGRKSARADPHRRAGAAPTFAETSLSALPGSSRTSFWSRGLEEERHGTYHLGSAVIATSPRLSVVDLPYPPDPIQPAAAIATIGDLIHGGARARTFRAVTVYAPTPPSSSQIGVEESAPFVFVVASTDQGEARITHSVRSQPDLVDLVQRALDLRNEARAV